MKLIDKLKKDKRAKVILFIIILILVYVHMGTKKTANVPQLIDLCPDSLSCPTGYTRENCHNADGYVSADIIGYYIDGKTTCWTCLENGKKSDLEKGEISCCSNNMDSDTKVCEGTGTTRDERMCGIGKTVMEWFNIDDCKTAFYITIFGGGMMFLLVMGMMF